MSNSTLGRIGCAFLLGLTVLAAAQADNIVVNGGFELPAVTDSHKWDIYTSIPGWELARGPSIELQRGVSGWLPSEGDQYLELDSDIDGPGGGLHGEDASSAVYQLLPTTPGGLYELTFAFSPRPGVADNALEVVWDGTILDNLTASGVGKSQTAWANHSYVVTATSDTTRLEFGDRSVSDSLGTFVDDVSVVAIPEPGSLMLLLGGLVAALRHRMA